eukprot:PhM_4_TR18551/c0_g1_i1/m.12931
MSNKALTSTAAVIKAAGTDLPGIPHPNRVTRLYRQWLKLALTFPKSELVDLNNHTQMNERALLILRQRFHEGSKVRDPERVRVMIYECERSLTMMRELSKDAAKTRFPPTSKHPNYFTSSFKELAMQNTKQWFNEFYRCYIKRTW